METTAHVLNACVNNMGEMTRRNDAVLARLQTAISKIGYATRRNRAFGDDSLHPDLVIETNEGDLIVDVTIPFDEPTNLQRAHDEKASKYAHLGSTLPFVVGSLGAWLQTNDLIASTLGVRASAWNRVRRDARLLAIRGSLSIARAHIRGDSCPSIITGEPTAPRGQALIVEDADSWSAEQFVPGGMNLERDQNQGNNNSRTERQISPPTPSL